MTPVSVPRGDALALTRALVAVDSRNPALVVDAPGEHAVALRLAEILTSWGLAVTVMDAAPGRPNVVARAKNPSTHSATNRSLLFNGHLDTVGVEGMIHAPWDPAIRDGRLYGRGATDMKAGVAAMCAAAVHALDAGLTGEIIITAVADEEYGSIGTRAIIDAGIRADAAIVTEPTRLAIVPAHRGFAWADLTVHGRAAHGSRYDIGVDANTLAALVMAEVEQHQQTVLTTRTHPLLGRPSVHAAKVSGGLGLSTYSDKCVVGYERRTLPGESAESFAAELQGACDRVRAARPELRTEIAIGFSQGPNDISVEHPIVRALDAALVAEQRPTPIEGLACWTDAALLSAAGIPAICFGPGDIALAHAAEEYVEVEEITIATRVLTRLALEWCGVAR
ncbi:MAG: M20/M25/M40 family metallo-hydrolase [Gemmatimonadetes bacterium]|nr:M20/M25/M40 family metallo-hydrolase [Gemmatimonadota bacterium]